MNPMVKMLCLATREWKKFEYDRQPANQRFRDDAKASLDAAWTLVSRGIYTVCNEGPRMAHRVRIEWSGPEFSAGGGESDYDWGVDEYQSHDRSEITRYALCVLADMKEEGYQSAEVYFDDMSTPLTMDDMPSLLEMDA